MTSPAALAHDPHEIGFARLHALVARGYRPVLGAASSTDGHTFITLRHPRVDRRHPLPPITLWSDGILATTAVLFPARFVPEDGKGPPDWQRYILPGEAEHFATFLAEIAPPRLVDLYLVPALAQTKLFAVRFAAAAGFCLMLAVSLRMLLRL